MKEENNNMSLATASEENVQEVKRGRGRPKKDSTSVPPNLLSKNPFDDEEEESGESTDGFPIFDSEDDQVTEADVQAVVLPNEPKPVIIASVFVGDPLPNNKRIVLHPEGTAIRNEVHYGGAKSNSPVYISTEKSLEDQSPVNQDDMLTVVLAQITKISLVVETLEHKLGSICDAIEHESFKAQQLLDKQGDLGIAVEALTKAVEGLPDLWKASAQIREVEVSRVPAPPSEEISTEAAHRIRTAIINSIIKRPEMNKCSADYFANAMVKTLAGKDLTITPEQVLDIVNNHCKGLAKYDGKEVLFNVAKHEELKAEKEGK
jgi:hypothetical protein